MPELPLLGLSILLVEDDPVIALDLAQTLADAGAVVVGPAHSVRDAMSLLDKSTPDAAVVDYRLASETAGQIVRRLEAEGRPYLFHTCSRFNPELARFGAPILDKPTRPADLIEAVLRLGGKA